MDRNAPDTTTYSNNYDYEKFNQMFSQQYIQQPSGNNINNNNYRQQLPQSVPNSSSMNYIHSDSSNSYASNSRIAGDFCDDSSVRSNFSNISNNSHEESSVNSGHASALVFKVQFKSTTDHFYLGESCPRDIAIGDYVKVEADRGHDVGMVADIFWPSAEEVQALAATNNKEIISLATEDEYLLSKGKARDETRALTICREVVAARNMQINLVDAEYQYDRKKLTFFFTSDGHTDFRELVRELFTIFKTRIWMQKIKPFEAAAFQRTNSPIPRFNGGGGSSHSSRHNSPSHGYNTSHPPPEQKKSGSPINAFHSPVPGPERSGDVNRVPERRGSGSSSLLKQATRQATQKYVSQAQSIAKGDDYNYRRYLQGRDITSNNNQVNTSPQNYLPSSKSSTQQSPQLQFHQMKDPFQNPTNVPVASGLEPQHFQGGETRGPQQYTSFLSYAARFSNTPPPTNNYAGSDDGRSVSPQGNFMNANSHAQDNSTGNSVGYGDRSDMRINTASPTSHTMSNSGQDSGNSSTNHMNSPNPYIQDRSNSNGSNFGNSNNNPSHQEASCLEHNEGISASSQGVYMHSQNPYHRDYSGGNDGANFYVNNASSNNAPPLSNHSNYMSSSNPYNWDHGGGNGGNNVFNSNVSSSNVYPLSNSASNHSGYVNSQNPYERGRSGSNGGGKDGNDYHNSKTSFISNSPVMAGQSGGSASMEDDYMNTQNSLYRTRSGSDGSGSHGCNTSAASSNLPRTSSVAAQGGGSSVSNQNEHVNSDNPYLLGRGGDGSNITVPSNKSSSHSSNLSGQCVSHLSDHGETSFNSGDNAPTYHPTQRDSLDANLRHNVGNVVPSRDNFMNSQDPSFRDHNDSSNSGHYNENLRSSDASSSYNPANLSRYYDGNAMSHHNDFVQSQNPYVRNLSGSNNDIVMHSSNPTSSQKSTSFPRQDGGGSTNRHMSFGEDNNDGTVYHDSGHSNASPYSEPNTRRNISDQNDHMNPGVEFHRKETSSNSIGSRQQNNGCSSD